MGTVEILAVPQAGEGTEITTPISSSDAFFVVVWKLLGMMTKFLGLGLGQNGPGDHKISDDEDEKKEM